MLDDWPTYSETPARQELVTEGQKTQLRGQDRAVQGQAVQLDRTGPWRVCSGREGTHAYSMCGGLLHDYLLQWICGGHLQG